MIVVIVAYREIAKWVSRVIHLQWCSAKGSGDRHRNREGFREHGATVLEKSEAGVMKSTHRLANFTRQVSYLRSILLAGTAASLMAALATSAHADCTVCQTGCSHTTISAAAAQCSGIVVVKPGSYLEQVKITRSGTSSAPFIFRAEFPGTVTVGEGKSHGFYISGASFVRLEDFRVRSTTSHGIRLLNCSNVDVVDNRVERAGSSGIYVKTCSNVDLTGNTVVESKKYRHQPLQRFRLRPFRRRGKLFRLRDYRQLQGYQRQLGQQLTDQECDVAS